LIKIKKSRDYTHYFLVMGNAETKEFKHWEIPNFLLVLKKKKRGDKMFFKIWIKFIQNFLIHGKIPDGFWYSSIQDEGSPFKSDDGVNRVLLKLQQLYPKLPLKMMEYSPGQSSEQNEASEYSLDESSEQNEASEYSLGQSSVPQEVAASSGLPPAGESSVPQEVSASSGLSPTYGDWSRMQPLYRC